MNWIILAYFSIALKMISSIEDEENKNFELTKEGEFYWMNGKNANQLLDHDRTMVIFYIRNREECEKCDEAKKIVSTFLPLYEKQFPGDPNFFIIDCNHDNLLCHRRLKYRSLPTLEIRINKRDVYYKGDFDIESLSKFLVPRLSNRIQKFSNLDFSNLKQNQTQNSFVITVLKNSNDERAYRMFENLMRFEFTDFFVDCDGKVECLLLFFQEPEANLVFIIKEKTSFLKIDDATNFRKIITEFNHFKNPIEISFDSHFQEKIIQGGNPVMLFVMDQNTTIADEGVKIFRSEANDYVKFFKTCIIFKEKLNNSDLAHFDKFAEDVGFKSYPLPLILMVEYDKIQKKIIKYYFSMSKITKYDLNNYIEAWLAKRLRPTPRNQNVHPHTHEGIKIISHDDFSYRVYAHKQESVVLIHHEFKNCEKSRKLLESMKQIMAEPKFHRIHFMIMNADMNDLPIHVDKTPTVLVFTDDMWESPIIYHDNNSSTQDLKEIIENRKILVKRPHTDQNKDDEYINNDL
jgi:hypothetical protein